MDTGTGSHGQTTYGPFHNSAPFSSVCVHWEMVGYYETGCTPTDHPTNGFKINAGMDSYGHTTYSQPTNRPTAAEAVISDAQNMFIPLSKRLTSEISTSG